MKIDGETLKDIHKQAQEYQNNGDDLEELVEEIYNADANYKNCNISSGQRCWDWDEIHKAVFSFDPVEQLMNDITKEE